jgi:TatD DNase family protein
MEFTDTHAHLDYDFEENKTVGDIIKEAYANSVTKIITVTSNPASLSKARAIAGDFENVFHSLGVHPHEAADFSAETEKEIQALNNKKCVAIGEIGLDYYYEHSPKDIQKKVFVRQIEIARELSLPVIIHTRNADKDTYDILSSEYRGNNCAGVIHCYSGTPEQLKKYLDLGMYVSFTGIITFPKAEEVKASAKYAPNDRIMIETDCPFLAPVPHRGKKNYPAYVKLIAEKLAEIRGIDLETVATLTNKNVKGLFKI